MAFPINDLLACFLEAFDLHLKLGAGSEKEQQSQFHNAQVGKVSSLAVPPQHGMSWAG